MLQTSDTSKRGIGQLVAFFLTDKSGYIAGDTADFDPTHAIESAQLFRLLKQTQRENVDILNSEAHLRRRVPEGVYSPPPQTSPLEEPPFPAAEQYPRSGCENPVLLSPPLVRRVF